MFSSNRFFVHRENTNLIQNHYLNILWRNIMNIVSHFVKKSRNYNNHPFAVKCYNRNEGCVIYVSIKNIAFITFINV